MGDQGKTMSEDDVSQSDNASSANIANGPERTSETEEQSFTQLFRDTKMEMLNIREAELMLKMEIRAISQDFVTLVLNFESYDQLCDAPRCDRDNLSTFTASVLQAQTPDNVSGSDDNHKLLELIESSFDGNTSDWVNGCGEDSSNTKNAPAATTHSSAATNVVVLPGGQCDTRLLPPGAQYRHDCLVQNISDICIAPNVSVQVANSPIDKPVQLNSTAIHEVKAAEMWSVESALRPLYLTPDFHTRVDALSSADESTPIARSHRDTRSGYEDTPTMTEDSLCRLAGTDRHISGFCSADWHSASEDRLSDPDTGEFGDGSPPSFEASILDKITSSMEATRDSEPNLSILTTPSSGTKSSDVTSSSIHFSPATSYIESSYKESDGGASCSPSPHSDTRCRLHRVLQRNVSRERLMARLARQRFLVSSSTGLSSDSVNDRPPPANSPNSNELSIASNDSTNRAALVPGTRPPCIGKEATPEGINRTVDDTTLSGFAGVDISDMFPDQFVIPAECKYNNAYSVNTMGVTAERRTPKRHKTCAKASNGAYGGRAGKRKPNLTPVSTTKKSALLRRLQNWGRQLRSGTRYNPIRQTAARSKLPHYNSTQKGKAASNMKKQDKEEEEEEEEL